LIKIHIERKEFRSAFKLIASLREYAEKDKQSSIDIQTRIFRASYMAELDIFDKLGEYEEGVKTVEEIEDKLISLESKFNKEHLIAFYLKFSVIYFGIGDFNKSLLWINKILNDNEKLLRQDLYAYARLINLVVHYELSNFDLIEYLIKSTQRFLNKKNRDFELEKVIIQYIRKLSKVSSAEKQEEIYRAFRSKIEELFEDPNNRILLKYFDFLSWVDSKIDSISLSEAVQRRHI
jgi:tetratricopeptide (TPR) repeat protein